MIREILKRRRFPALVMALAAALLAGPAFGAPSGVYAQDAAPASAEYYCWVTGVVEDHTRGVDDRTWGGGEGWLASVDDWGVTHDGGKPVYVHATGSGRGWSKLRYGPAEGNDRHSDYSGMAFHALSRHWARNYDNTAYRPATGAAPELGSSNVGEHEYPATNAIAPGGDYWHEVGGVSHGSRVDLVDFLFFQQPRVGAENTNRWRRLVEDAYVVDSDATWDSGPFSDRTMWSPHSVAVPVGGAPLQEISVRWIDQANPEGGDSADDVALLQQSQAVDAGLVARTDVQASQGNELTHSVEQGTAYNLSGNMTCSGSSCNTRLTSTEVAVTSRAQSVETNNGEVQAHSVDATGQVAQCQPDSAGNCDPAAAPLRAQADIDPIQLNELGTDPAAFKRQLYSNTLRDQLEVVITLRSDYRADLANFHGESFARFGRFPGLGDRVRRDEHSGVYRQPYLTAPVSLPGSTFNRRGGSDASAQHNGGGSPLLLWDVSSADGWPLGQETSVIRWPTYLKDVSWYLFELPERDADLAPGEAQPALPSGPDDPLWPSRYTWRHNAELWKLTARSAYGVRSTSSLPGSRVYYPQCTTVSGNPAQSQCYNDDASVNLDGEDYDDSNRPWSLFPFYTAGTSGPLTPDPGALQPGWLKMAGTAGPADGEETGYGRNVDVSFTITEGDLYGGSVADTPDAGWQARERMGQPAVAPTGSDGIDANAADAWLASWPQEAIDPNRTHLLVLTFYEIRQVDDFEFKVDRRGRDETIFRQPTWQVRRVLCRIMVGDLATVSGESWLKKTFGKIGDGIVGAVLAIPRFIGNLLGQIIGGAVRAAEAAGQEPMRVVCAGVTGFRQVSGSPSVTDLRNAVVDGGNIVVSAARRVELSALQACEDESDGIQVQTAQVAPLECDGGSVLDGETGTCWALPKPELFRDRTYWVLPPPITTEAYQRYACDPEFGPAQVGDDGLDYYPFTGYPTDAVCRYRYRIDSVNGARLPDVDPVRKEITAGHIRITGGTAFPLYYHRFSDAGQVGRPPLTDNNVGLASTKLRWHLPPESRPEQAALVRGWLFEVAQDPQMVSYSGLGSDGISDDGYVIRRYAVSRLYDGYACAGDVLTNPVDNNVGVDFDELTVGDIATVITGAEALNRGCPMPRAGHWAQAHAGLSGDLEDLAELVDMRMPLSPGLRHGFRVSAYSGAPGQSSFTVGPASDWLWLDGDDEACRDLLRDGADAPADRNAVSNPHVFSSGADGRARERQTLNRLYRCADWDVTGKTPADANATALGGARLPAEAVNTDFLARSGVLTPLMNSDICRDIFTGTPGRFLWDNSVVRNLWKLMWVLAGMVLAALLAWQALRMTYDMWVEPRPSYGLREMLPRVLLALVLAASSLFICEIVLSLVHDLGCFVAEATGTTLWGFLGNNIGGLVLAWLSNMRAYYAGLLGVAGALFTLDFGQMAQSLGQFLTGAIRFWFLSGVVLLGILLVLIIWVKVVIQMMTRIVFLAALIVFSPLAFAMYASDATAHWTKWWVSAFLGAAFQQAVVLIVLALGGAMMIEVIRFDDSTWHGSQEPGLLQLVMAIIMGFLAIFLASSVPRIVNPKGQGMFDSVRQLGQMALAGAIMAATMGAGALAGGIAGAGGAAAGGGGGATPAAPGAGAAPGGGTDPSGGVTGGSGSGGGGGFAGRLAGAAQRAGTGARGFASGASEGAVSGFRQGQNVNMRMRDVLGGNFMYRGGSQSDDRAVQMEGSDDRQKEMLEELRSISQSLAGAGGSQPAAPQPLPSQPASPLYTPPTYQRGGSGP